MGMQNVAAGLVLFIGWSVFLLMWITAAMGVSLRSRVAAIASVVLVAFLLTYSGICFVDAATLQVHRPHWAEAYRKHGTIWLGGVVVSAPVTISAMVLALRKKLTATRELAAMVLTVVIFIVLAIIAWLVLVTLLFHPQ